MLAVPPYIAINIYNNHCGAYLHSHEHYIPTKLEHDNDRISSGGQQVVGFGDKADMNSKWILEPHGLSKMRIEKSDKPEEKFIKIGDEFRLLHNETQTYLRTHNVAAPMTPSNFEVSTFHKNVAEYQSYYNDSIFVLKSSDHSFGETAKSKVNLLRFVSVAHNVALSCDETKLPNWGFYMKEISGFRYIP